MKVFQICWFTIFCAVVLAQQVAPPTKARPRFSLNVVAENKEVKVGDPVIVTSTLTNVSGNELSITMDLAAKGEVNAHDGVIVRDSNGKEPPKTDFHRDLKGEAPSARSVSGSSTTITVMNFRSFSVSPGAKFVQQIEVSKLYDLSKVGSYSVQLTGIDDVTKIVVKSNAITITVTP